VAASDLVKTLWLYQINMKILNIPAERLEMWDRASRKAARRKQGGTFKN